MELTLKRVLEHAEFKKYRGKGYDTAEVDDFIDKAAAMAAKVEVQLAQALEAANQGGGPTQDDIQAEVERRVAQRLAEEAEQRPAAASEEEAAEEVRRTIIMAQRTADAAVREAREDAEKIVGSAKDQAETTLADADARAAALTTEATEYAAASRAEVEAEATRERREARAGEPLARMEKGDRLEAFPRRQRPGPLVGNVHAVGGEVFDSRGRADGCEPGIVEASAETELFHRGQVAHQRVVRCRQLGAIGERHGGHHAFQFGGDPAFRFERGDDLRITGTEKRGAEEGGQQAGGGAFHERYGSWEGVSGNEYSLTLPRFHYGGKRSESQWLAVSQSVTFTDRFQADRRAKITLHFLTPPPAERL